MLKLTIKYCLLCAGLCIAFIAKSQDAKVADSLLQLGKYKEAALVYEYAYFNSNNQQDQVTFLLSKSFCEKKGNMYNEALNTLQRISLNNLSNQYRYIVWSQKALMNFLLNDYENARAELNNVKDNLELAYSDSILILEVLTLNQLGEWDLAKNTIMKYPQYSALIDSLYQFTPRLKNEKLALVLSGIVPGSGQIYAGYPAEGLLSIGFLAATLFGGYALFTNGFYFSSISSGGGLALRFYTGGARRAKYLAEKRNAIRTERFNNLIKNQLIK